MEHEERSKRNERRRRDASRRGGETGKKLTGFRKYRETREREMSCQILMESGGALFSQYKLQFSHDVAHERG